MIKKSSVDPDVSNKLCFGVAANNVDTEYNAINKSRNGTKNAITSNFEVGQTLESDNIRRIFCLYVCE